MSGSNKQILEEILMAWQDALYSDLENGVAWINEDVNRQFGKDYPTISNFGIVLNKIATRVAEEDMQKKD